ncbi:unnamed protein product, partial [Didymodactylos carnosus]
LRSNPNLSNESNVNATTAKIIQEKLDEKENAENLEAEKILHDEKKKSVMGWCSIDDQVFCNRQLVNNEDRVIECQLSEADWNFWLELIEKYLEPIKLDDATKKKTHFKLTEFRNGIVIGSTLITSILVIAQFQIAVISDKVEFQIKIYLGDRYLRVDYLTLILLFFYLVQILLQIIGLLYHRLGTVLELLSIVTLRSDRDRLDKQLDEEDSRYHSLVQTNQSNQPGNHFMQMNSIYVQLPKYNLLRDLYNKYKLIEELHQAEERIRKQHPTIGRFYKKRMSKTAQQLFKQEQQMDITNREAWHRPPNAPSQFHMNPVYDSF